MYYCRSHRRRERPRTRRFPAGGVECDGFAILANKGKGGTNVIHGISNIDLAALIAGNDEMMAASVIAKALREARDITADKPAKILAGILGGIGK